MLPASVAVAMFGFVGALGSGAVPTAHALAGDICGAETTAQPASDYSINFQSPVDYVVGLGETHGLVFHLEDDYNLDAQVQIDSETGSARITSKAEILSWEDGRVVNDTSNEVQAQAIGYPNVGHLLVTPSVETQNVDVIEPDDFNDPDGNDLSGINDWLTDVAGMPAFAEDGYHGLDEGNYCGYDDDDGWGFIDFKCIEPGYFHIDILPSNVNFPNQDFDSTELGGMTLKFYCPGQADTATIATQYSKLETSAATGSHDSSIITVTVEDQFGDRLDGAEVTFSTDNCKFDSASDISPAGGGTTVTTWTDTAGTSDSNYLANNPLEHAAGTAEATLNCTKGTPGTATITAIVQRPGSDIVLSQDVTVVGPTALTGLTLTLNPNDLECGNTILAVANAVDSLGQPVSDNTLVYFTTDTSSGISGGLEGAQGGIQTKSGEAQVLIATDPGNPGTHTVIAYALDASDNIVAQTSKTYTCDAAVAPAAPTVVPPATGTGTGSITPPNTGDAGLAAGSTSNASLFVIAGAVAMVLAGLASIKFARN